PRQAPEGGLWLRDPDGNLLNVREDAAPAPGPAESPTAFNGPGYAPRQAVRGAPARDLAVAPRRLGHVLLFTPDIDRQVDFYSRVLGLKLSDRSQDIIAFLRCTTDHHNVALLKSSAPGFHHASFEMGGVDEIGMGAARMADRGWQPGWGFGRHVIGSNFFYYIRDPWGSFAEYFYDIDQIPESCAWEPRDFPADDSLYVWGPPVPADFGENKEALAYMALHLLPELAQPTPTKIVPCSLDGLGGLPRPGTGKSELETARLPNLHALAARSACGLLRHVGPGITPGSGPGHLGLFGYDPLQHPVGRGVLEALGIDFHLKPGDVAARGNFCTVDGEGRITDRRAGRIATDLCIQLCERLRAITVDGVELIIEPVKEHRFVLVLRGDGLSGRLSETDPQALHVP